MRKGKTLKQYKKRHPVLEESIFFMGNNSSTLKYERLYYCNHCKGNHRTETCPYLKHTKTKIIKNGSK